MAALAVVVLLDCAMFGVVEWQISRLANQMLEAGERIEQFIPQIEVGQVTRTDNWTSGGQPKTHTSTKLADETIRQFWDRHDAAVAALMAEFPPDGG